MSQVVLVGVIGLLGLTFGMLAARRRSAPPFQPLEDGGPTLASLPFTMLIVLSLVLQWLSAPTNSIATEAYSGEQGALAESLNFPSAGLVAHVILVLLFVDGQADGRRRSKKCLAVCVVTAVIVAWFDLRTGNREATGLIAALVALWLMAGVARRRRFAGRRWFRQRIISLFPVGALLVLVFVALGVYRFTLGEESPTPTLSQAVSGGLDQSTWKAVLLTNLGIAAEYRFGTMEYLYGRTYVDYALQLPPGIITQKFDLARPLDGEDGPAYWTKGISSGGLHIALVPFKNFGAFGMWCVLALYGFAIGNIDRRAASGRRYRFLYGVAFAVSFTWFWYGEMPALRAVMLWWLLWWLYRLMLRSSVRRPATFRRRALPI